MRLAAVLLVGGESRRMGRDKAMLLLDGVPLWRRQLDLLHGLTCAVLVSARLRPPWLPDDAWFIPDSVPARGPLGGLATALAATDATHLLALPVDLPAMDAAHLDALWAAATPGCGVLPWIDGQAEPLPAIYPAEALPVATGLLAGADVSLRAFTAALLAAARMKKQTIAPADAKLYENCNFPADWDHHLAQHQSTHDRPGPHG